MLDWLFGRKTFQSLMPAQPIERLRCRCLDPEWGVYAEGPSAAPDENRRRRAAAGDVTFHTEAQDTDSEAWKTLLQLIDEAAATGARKFAPLHKLPPGQETEIVTLPASIAKLKEVEKLDLYGSSLVRIPPEIGEMESLEEFVPYTSYRLHWFPYEITRCAKLRNSTVSTRALYGNFKFRPAFPRLDPDTQTGQERPATCSVCNGPTNPADLRRRWISLRVATDVLPLIVNACSEECIRRLPTPPDGFVQEPHLGGMELQQPPPP
jgi:hypothetical protein